MYARLPTEETHESTKDSDKYDHWPITNGTVEFRDVSLTYEHSNSCVLRNVSFKIEDKEKV